MGGEFAAALIRFPAYHRAGKKSTVFFPLHSFPDGLQDIALQTLTGCSGSGFYFNGFRCQRLDVDLRTLCVVSVIRDPLFLVDRHSITPRQIIHQTQKTRYCATCTNPVPCFLQANKLHGIGLTRALYRAIMQAHQAKHLRHLETHARLINFPVTGRRDFD